MDSQKIIKRTYIASMLTMFFYAANRVLIPLSLENIKTDLSLSYTQAGSFSFVGSALQFIIMIISIFMAARFGKIKVIKVAIFLITLGMLLFSGSKIFIIALLIFLIIASGEALLDAMLTPLVVDLYPNDKGSKQILLHAFWPIGIISISPIIGFLLSKDISWRYIFMVFAIIVFLLILLYPSSKNLRLNNSSNDLREMTKILKSFKFWLFSFAMIFTSVVEASFTYWLPSYVQNMFGTKAFEAAIAATFFALGMAIGRLFFSRLAKIINLLRLIIIASISLFVTVLLFNYFKNLYVIYAVVFFVGLFIAPFWPALQSYAVEVIKLDATIIMVFLSCVGIPGASFGVMMVALIADKYGFSKTFIFLPIFVILAIGMILLVKLNLFIEKKKKIA